MEFSTVTMTNRAASAPEEKKPPKTGSAAGKTIVYDPQGITGPQAAAVSGNSDLIAIGGLTTGVLRYPHMELYRIKQIEKESHDIRVLILGPGLKTDQITGENSCPQLHEIAAAFPPQAHMMVVDCASFVNELALSVFSKKTRGVAESILTVLAKESLSLFSPEQIANTRDYVRQIPEKPTQRLETQQADFAAFVPGAMQYHYIFAMQSLFYSLASVREKRPDSLRIIAKYLGALKRNGSLLIDELCYRLMQEKIQAMPTSEELAGNAAVSWLYAKTSAFTSRRARVPNTLMHDGAPQIYFMRDGRKCFISTSDIYILQRL